MAKGKINPEPEFAAFVGIDWADRKHVWCLQAAGSTKRETGELEHKVEAVEAWGLNYVDDSAIVQSRSLWNK